MKYSICTQLRIGFTILCVLATIGMAEYWSYKYTLDQDLCLVDFETFKDTNKSVYPVISMCFSDPFLNDKLKEHGVIKSRYLRFLKGETTDPNLTTINYNNITLNLMDYSTKYYVAWDNGTKIRYQAFEKTAGIKLAYETYSGFWYGTFIKCFGIEVSSKEVDYITLFYKQNIFPNSTRPSGRKPKKKELFIVFFHYPEQLLKSILSRTSTWPEHNRRFDYKMEFNIKTMDILRQRNKASKPCIEDKMPYDTNITKQIVEKAGCVTPYQKQKIDLPVCETGEQMKKALVPLEKSTPVHHDPPCQYIENIQYSYR